MDSVDRVDSRNQRRNVFAGYRPKPDRQAMLDDRLNDLHALKLVHADRDESTSVHGQRSSSNAGHQPEPAKHDTFQFSGNATSELGTHIHSVDNLSYVKSPTRISRKTTSPTKLPNKKTSCPIVQFSDLSTSLTSTAAAPASATARRRKPAAQRHPAHESAGSATRSTPPRWLAC